MYIAIVTAEPSVLGVKELVRAGQELGVTIRLINPYDTDAATRINQADRLIYRLSPRLYSRYRELLHEVSGGAKVQLENILQAGDKIRSSQALAEHDIPMPESVIIRAASDVKDRLPSVLKVAVGHKGEGVYLAHGIDELRLLSERLLKTGEPFLQQEYIAESSGNDKRIFVVGGSVVASMRRIAAGDNFRANLALGGRAESYSLTTEEADMAVAAVRVLGLPFAGVDLIDSARGPLLLEVNPSPGLQISQTCGVDVAKSIIKHVAESEK